MVSLLARVMVLAMAPARAMAAPMDSYNAASGFGTFNLAALFTTLLYAVLAAYGMWTVTTGVVGWASGSVNALALFFIVCRCALLLVLASALVGMVT